MEQKAFGNPDEVVICIGDWEHRIQMKYIEPILGKGMRTLFRKNNYNVFLVDEFRTNCKCSNCDGGVCEKFRVRNHPNKNKDVLRSTTVNSQWFIKYLQNNEECDK
jgi:hypothetical protein